MADAVPLRRQLACARRELAAMSAIVRTLQTLVEADGGAGGQAELFDARAGSEEQV